MPYEPADIRVRINRDRAALRIANAAVLVVGQRAFDRGEGVDDRPHAPYTKRYGARKFKRTGNPRVDLTVTGRMRRSLRAEPTGNGTATIRLRGSGKPDYSVHVNARRPWFGLSPSDRAKLRPIVRRAVQAAMVPPQGSR